ncbi:MAG: FUSC family protein [Burkholderiales bacterium]
MLEWLFGERLTDADRSGLHRALRVALVMPTLYAVGVLVRGDRDFALLAAFGAFAALAMADFMGPTRSRLRAMAGLTVVGALLVAAGTALSQTLWPAVIVMFAVALALQFLMALGGQFALGNNAALLAFVVCAMVPSGDAALPSRLAGWFTAMACAMLVGNLLWPRNERRDLYLRIVDALRPMAEAARATAAGAPAGDALSRSLAAIDAVRDEQRALGFRTIGPPEHQQALMGIIDALGQGWRFLSVAAAADREDASDHDLVRAVADTFDAIARVMAGCAAGGRRPHVCVDALAAARHAHRERLDSGAKAALAAHVPGAAIVERFAAAFPARVLSFVTLAMAVDAGVLSRHGVRLHDDFAVLESPRPQPLLARVADVLRPHLHARSVWLHNSLRAALALAAAMLVAKASDLAHGFWIVLATLAVLRSNVATTGSTVVNAVAGTFAGMLVAALAILVLSPHPWLMWLALPPLVFLAAYANAAISFGAGQAMFACLVVMLFNLVEPEGWMTGVVRLEAVAIGAAVALGTSLLMWPRGATAALRVEIAAHLAAAERLVDAAFAALLGEGEHKIARAEAKARAARSRADEALASYMGERSAKQVPLAVWGHLARLPVHMRLAADAVLALERTGYRRIGGSPADAAIAALAGDVRAAFLDFAARVTDPQRPPDPVLRHAILDLDLIGGDGESAARVLEQVVVEFEAAPDRPSAVPALMAAVWGVGWLAYLARILDASEDALAATAAASVRA